MKTTDYTSLNSLYIYPASVLLCVGIIGNTLSFVIYKRKVFRDRAIANYLSVLAVFDSFNLIVYQLSTRAVYTQTSITYCRFMNFLVSFMPNVCSWLVMLVSADRLVSTLSPMSIQILSKKWLQYSFMVAVVVLQAIFHAYNFLIAALVLNKENNQYQCMYYMSPFLYNIVYVKSFNQTFFPVVIMLTCSLYMVKYLVDSKKKIKKGSSSAFKEKQFAFMTLFLNFFFFVCFLPFDVYLILSHIFMPFNISYLSESWNWYVAQGICKIFLYIHSSASFFVYLLVNRLFRQEVLSILYIFRKRIRKTSTSTNSTSNINNSQQKTASTVISN
jgi:hypothetical protein